jgi:endo-1,4-beta-xylanase
MKKNKYLYVFLIVILIISVFGIQAFAIPKSTEALKGTPVIDGEPDGIWEQAKEIEVKTQSFTFTTNASPCTAKVKTLWDENNLYCLAEIKDPVISDKGIKPWDRDSIEFVIDQSNNKKEEGHHYDEHGGHYRVEAVNGEITGRYDAYEKAAAAGTLKAKAILTEDGYRVEIAMPWTTLLGKTEPGTTIGFQVAINDDSGVGTRDGIIQWNSEDAWSVAHTEKIGNLVLSAEAVTETSKETVQKDIKGTFPIVFIVIPIIVITGIVLFLLARKKFVQNPR